MTTFEGPESAMPEGKNSGRCELQHRSRMTVEEIALRLDIGRLAVYMMLERGILPGVRVGKRWIITRHAYEEWERTCGMRPALDLKRRPEVSVVN